MTACQKYRETHGEPETWAPGEIDGYLDAVAEDRAHGAEDKERGGKSDGRHHR